MCVFKTLIRQICSKLLAWQNEFAELKIEKWAISAKKRYILWFLTFLKKIPGQLFFFTELSERFMIPILKTQNGNPGLIRMAEKVY